MAKRLVLTITRESMTLKVIQLMLGIHGIMDNLKSVKMKLSVDDIHSLYVVSLTVIL